MGAAEQRAMMITEARAGRASAEALLRLLIDARTAAASGLRPLRRPDLLLGPDEQGLPVDSAIESTRRLVERYNRFVEEACSALSDEDLELLVEIRSEAAEGTVDSRSSRAA